MHLPELLILFHLLYCENLIPFLTEANTRHVQFAWELLVSNQGILINMSCLAVVKVTCSLLLRLIGYQFIFSIFLKFMYLFKNTFIFVKGLLFLIFSYTKYRYLLGNGLFGFVCSTVSEANLLRALCPCFIFARNA